MIIDVVPELSIMAVLHRGIANQECIALQATETVDLGRFGVMIGYQPNPSEGAVPVRDNLFWFGNGYVEKGSWIFVYTAAGTPRKTTSLDGKSPMYIVHWGRNATMFANSAIVPILFRIDAATVGEAPMDQPQYPALTQQPTS